MNYDTSKLNYENIIGPIKNRIQKNLKKIYKAILGFPNSLSKAIEISKKYNPELIIAKLELNQSEKDVEIAESDLKPTAKLIFRKILH